MESFFIFHIYNIYMNDKIIFRFKNIDNINGFGRKFLFAQVKTGRSKIAQSSLNVIWKWKAFYNFGLSFNFSLTGFISSVKCYMLMKFFRWESSTFLGENYLLQYHICWEFQILGNYLWTNTVGGQMKY